MGIPRAVIGAGYGDEGKGLITDYLCVKHGADIVVRFNGGAQAGHTVQTPAGERHVFSHFGSGTYAGAATYLSSFFVINPMVFFKEAELLYTPLRRTVPDVYVDERALITTPYDILINQLAEKHRGDGRHGSCGIGFGETIERTTECISVAGIITWGVAANPSELKVRLAYVRDTWFPWRCRQLGIDPALGDNITKNDNIFNNFINDVQDMHKVCHTEPPPFLSHSNQLIFEGAQGLLLDQDSGMFPHVTRSNTGLTNISSISQEIGYEAVDVTYVTRCYTTRHGAGPLKNELTSPPYKGVYDNTNISNTFQGSLRFSYLDADAIKKAIQQDLISAQQSGLDVESGLAVTCLDQLNDEPAKVFMNGSLQKIKSDAYGDVADAINAHVGLKLPLIKSHGPTRETVTQNDLVEA